jgi:hypothetical protein
MTANAFVVDRSLGAVPVSRLLDVRSQLRLDGAFAQQVLLPGDRPVLTGDQTLQPNMLYPAEKNQSVRYYLPQYQVSIGAGGQPAVELRFKAGAEGEVGRLAITMTWTPPVAQGLEVRAIDAVVVPTLRYRIPVQAAGGATPGGGWERTTALQPLQATGATLLQSITIFSDKGLFDSVYQALSRPEQGATLDLLIRARVGMRTWRQVIVGQPTWADQTKVLANRGVLFTQMLHADTLHGISAVPASGAARVMMIKTAPAPTAMIGAVNSVTPATAAVATAAPNTAFATARLATAPSAIAARPIAVRRMTVGTAAPAARFTAVTAAATAGTAVFTPVAGTRSSAGAVLVKSGPAASAQTATLMLARLNTPNLKQAVKVSDFQIAGRNVVPLNVALDTTRQPAVVDADLENHQTVPFSFDPAQPVNRGVFVEGYDSGLHLLVPLSLVAPDGSLHTVYRDSLMREVIHIPPSGFRLERDETAPFLPAISFLASDFSTTDNDDNADVLFRVVAAYRLEPWLDPDIVELARAELAKENLVAHFTTGTAHDAKLSLDLDLLGDAQVRSGATVDPDTGISDTLDLDHQTFVRVWRERLAVGGVRGWVEYQLFDGSPARVPVELSLRQTSGELFDVTFVGPVADHPGTYRVTVRNRVESPVRITKLPPELIAGGGVAHAVNPDALLNQLLQPEETRQIDYDAAGAGADVVDFSPTVLGQAEPNLSALLRLLMVARGYTSLGFSVSVHAADGVFAPPAAGTEPLTGLLVEFDDGTRANLSPTADRVDVTVVGRLIDQILGTADDSQRFFYRVTNLHASGEGARTSWTEGHGTAPLEVSSAVVRLDF